jgi:hypothetical protein
MDYSDRDGVVAHNQSDVDPNLFAKVQARDMPHSDSITRMNTQTCNGHEHVYCRGSSDQRTTSF